MNNLVSALILFSLTLHVSFQIFIYEYKKVEAFIVRRIDLIVCDCHLNVRRFFCIYTQDVLYTLVTLYMLVCICTLFYYSVYAVAFTILSMRIWLCAKD